MNYELWLEKAIKALDRLKDNTPYKLRDLYEGHEWKSLSIGDRLNYGRYFKNQVANGKIDGLKYWGKAGNGSAQYIKKLEDNP